MAGTGRYVIVAAAVLALGGCMDPVEPDVEYEVELAVAGGIAADDYSFAIEGENGEVRGVSCESGCAWQSGELLAELPLSKRMAIASEFDLAGFLDLAQTEYGVDCCDLLEYTLTYRKDGRERTVHGTSNRLPADLNALVATVRGTIEPE